MTSDKIICFGEILWDIFPEGKMLGGAPFNVASSIHGLGGDVQFISRVGQDALGTEIIKKVKSYGLSTEFIQSDTFYATGKVLVSLEKNGSALYEIEQDAAWDFIKTTPAITTKTSESSAFIFGSLVARSASKKTLKTLLKLSKFSVFDLNLRAPFYDLITLSELMMESDMLKFNDDELYEIASALGSPFHSLDQHIEYLVAKTNTPIICVTKGMHGAVLYYHGDWFYNSGYKVKVRDTVGAGDSFLATLVLGFVRGNSIQNALNDACGMGAMVASNKGANPFITKEALATFVSPV
jgi:fructokinase|tara:strand:- start:304 stop:1191 length:888 start_codon:yes stop_codon:yes gene_type:complete